jgi:phosphoserine phosphatase
MGHGTHDVALADLDDTLVDGQTVGGLISYLTERGGFDPPTASAWFAIYNGFLEGKVAYSQYVEDGINTYARGLAGQQVKQIDDLGLAYVMANQEMFFPYVHELLGMLAESPRRTQLIIVSGSPAATHFGRFLGTDCVHTTKLKIAGGVYTGEVERNAGSRSMKQQLAQRYRDRIVMALGDSDSDVVMATVDRHTAFVAVGAPHEKCALVASLSSSHETFLLDPRNPDTTSFADFVTRVLDDRQLVVG